MTVTERLAVRRAGPEDLQALAELDQASLTQRSVAQVTRPLPGIGFFDLVKSNGHPDARCFVAVDQETGQVVGSAFEDLEQVSWNGKATLGGYLFRLRVHPDYRRRGVGRVLAAHWEMVARSAGAGLTWLAVVKGNEASRAFCRKGGYGYGSRIEYKTVPLLLASPWVTMRGRRSTVRRIESEDSAEVEALRTRFSRDHQLWARRRYSPASREYVALDRGGSPVACAVCFEQFRIARVRKLAVNGLPALANRLLAPLASRLASRYVFVRHLAFTDVEAAHDLLAWLAARYRGQADLLVVGADTRSEAQRAIRRLPGLTGWVDLLVKTNGQATDTSRPYHAVLG